MEARRFYVVRASRAKGTVTYNCPTPEWALRKLRDFIAAHYKDISVTDPDGRPLSEAALEARISGVTAPALT